MILRRFRYYPVYLGVFTLLYVGMLYVWGVLPGYLVIGILGISVAKDLIDELRLRSGESPIAYATIEHNPSNIVLVALIGLGYVDFGPHLLGIERSLVAIGLAGFDIVLDGWQDLRVG